MKLDKAEQDLLTAHEKGRLDLRPPDPALLHQFAMAAHNTFKKDRRINIRLSDRDLSGIQREAAAEGIPYQTLISGLIHKYVEGSLTLNRP